MRPTITLLALTSIINLIPGLATVAQAAQVGERWEYTSKMQSDQAQGFSMPAMTMQMCQEPGWKNPPKGQQFVKQQDRNYRAVRVRSGRSL